MSEWWVEGERGRVNRRRERFLVLGSPSFPSANSDALKMKMDLLM